MKPNIAFVTGGYSGESVISYKSAITIEKHVDKEAYNFFKIDITPEGWWYLPEGSERSPVNKEDFSIMVGDKKQNFDAVLVGIHGSPGEDGKLQGYLDLVGLPYTSCDTATSALTFNKRYTVAVAAFSGIAVAKSAVLIKGKFDPKENISADLKFPVFVKPNNGGSSIGISKVNHPGIELDHAISKAFNEDDQVLIEEFITGREFTIGVFRSRGEIIALPITEIITKKEFFDFEAKYSPGFTDEITPAQVDEEIAERVRAAARKAYQVFNCDGIIRIDFIFNEDRFEPFLLEINTVPGQSAASLVPQQVNAMGWTLKQFYSALIEDALTRKKWE
jgi:D-alanine-D-alanine ligase